MKLIVTAAVLPIVLLTSASSMAQVQFLGCYVEENNQCADVEISCGSNPADNYDAFDTTIGRLCDQVLLRDQQLATLNANLTSLNNAVTSQTIERDAYKSLYTKLLAEKTATALRIRQLRQVCSRKCRRL
jgi:hypothetical protein